MTRIRKSSRFLAALLALTSLAEPAAAAKAGPAEKPQGLTQPDACALAYHAALSRLAAEDLPLLREGPAPAAPVDAPAAADDSLPGQPLFVPPSRQRNAAEISALTAGVALARSKGRSTTVTGAGSNGERTWIAARLREDLGDYLRQKPTPYLCSGVPAYLDTMRRFAARLGPMGDRREAWITTQRGLAERSVTAAGEAIAKARANAPRTVSQTDLRPSADLARTDASPAVKPAPALDGEAGLLAAIDGLVADARAAGLVSEPPMPQVTGATAPTPPAPSRTVLGKLVELRPLVVSARPLVQDRTVRLKLLAAFADIEMLDYLIEAKPETPDSVAAAIGRTLDHIGEAHRTDCTCSN